MRPALCSNVRTFAFQLGYDRNRPAVESPAGEYGLQNKGARLWPFETTVVDEHGNRLWVFRLRIDGPSLRLAAR